MSHTSRTARTIRSRRPRWEVVVVTEVGHGRYVGGGHGRRQDAMAAAERLALRPGAVATVQASVDVEVARYALIDGAWVPNPTTVDIVAATREIDPGYARQLWCSLATRATDKGRAWTCAYINSADQAVAWAWSERVNADTLATARLAA